MKLISLTTFILFTILEANAFHMEEIVGNYEGAPHEYQKPCTLEVSRKGHSKILIKLKEEGMKEDLVVEVSERAIEKEVQRRRDQGYSTSGATLSFNRAKSFKTYYDFYLSIHLFDHVHHGQNAGRLNHIRISRDLRKKFCLDWMTYGGDKCLIETVDKTCQVNYKF